MYLGSVATLMQGVTIDFMFDFQLENVIMVFEKNVCRRP